MIDKATTEEIRLILKMISKGYKVPKIVYDVVYETAKREIEDKERVVLYKRDPNIHSRRIQGSYIKVTKENTIEIHPLACGGFGADFDGDQMALFAPLSEEAQQEIKNKMITLNNTTKIGASNFDLGKEIVVGIFTMTVEIDNKTPIKKIKTVEEAEKLFIGQKIEVIYKGKNRKTTVGRFIFNSVLPEWYDYVEDEVNKKYLDKILKEIILKSQQDYAMTVDKVMDVGFLYATKYPKSIDLEMLKIPPHLDELRHKLTQTKDVSEQSDIVDTIEKEMMKYLKETHSDLYFIVASGGSKGPGQLRQMMVCKGLISDPNGNILPPITKAINEGYSPQEYFEVSPSSRKGTADRAINTGNGGYAYRKMIYCIGNTQADINNPDCATRRTMNIKLTNELFSRMTGRYVQDENMRIIPIDKSMIGTIINLRSPIFCKTESICRICYGDLIKQVNTRNVGMIAAQEVASLSEKIMKSEVGLIQYNNKFYTMDDLWDSLIQDPIIEQDLETKIFEDDIQGKNGFVKTNVMQKHPRKDKMLFISTKSGHTLICQANHPLWIKKNPMHHKYDNRTCRLSGYEEYKSWGSGSSKIFTIDDDELIEKEARDVCKYDAIWVDGSFPVNNNETIMPEINGYLVGAYCGDGLKLDYEDRWTKGDEICQIDGFVKDRIIEESYEFDEFKVYDTNIVYKDPEYRINNIILGRYAWGKHLEPNFINYDKEWLRNFLAGYIDTDGTVFNSKGSKGGTCCRIYTCSYNLVQQLKMICLKLGYHMNTTIVPPDKKNGKADKQKRVNFSCDIRFYDKSEPINSEKLKRFGDIKPLMYKKGEIPIKGFDPITIIKEIWTWDYPVYDISTDTNEFLLGCVQNHNSFHLGGAVIMEKFDYVKQFMDNLDNSFEPLLRKLVEQSGSELINRSNLAVIRIDKSIYESSSPVKLMDDHIPLDVGHFTLTLDKLEVPVAIEQPMKLYIPDETEIDENNIVLIYNKNDKMMFVKPKQENFSQLARYLDTLVGGKYPWGNIPTLYMKFFKALSTVGSWDSTHLEVMLSNLLRAKKDPQKPARLIEPFDPEMYSIKTLPNIISYPLGIAFENFSKGIQYGLISERAPESAIEKVMFGEPLYEKGKK